MSRYHLIRPALFLLDAERAHQAAIAWLQLRAVYTIPATPAIYDPWPRLVTTVAGLRFHHPVGLAAGLDKDGRAAAGLASLGFGSVEIGTLTPLPQPGNSRPRLFRLASDEAIINRMGFNNGGLDAALARLRRYPHGFSCRLGINVGANKESADRIADYAQGVAAAAPLADYVTINVSSPNTPGLRDLQDPAALAELLARCAEARGGTPLFLKVAPDLSPREIDGIARTAIDGGAAALIVSNTTVSRRPLRSRAAGEAGGLSGRPLRTLALQRLRDFRAATGGALPLVGVGGIASAEDAYERIRAGASLIQLYSALIYEGLGLPRRIAAGLDRLIGRDGFRSIAEAVGGD